MSDLSPEERQRIYLEEKARLEAQRRLAAEVADQEKKRPSKAMGCLVGFLGLAVIGAIVSLFTGGGSSIGTDSTAVEKPRATYASGLDDATTKKLRQAKRLMVEEGVIHAWEGSTAHLDVTVGRSFYALSFDEKQNMMKVLAMAESLDADGRIVLHDYYSGREIGDYMLLRLRMKTP